MEFTTMPPFPASISRFEACAMCVTGSQCVLARTIALVVLAGWGILHDDLSHFRGDVIREELHTDSPQAKADLLGEVPRKRLCQRILLSEDLRHLQRRLSQAQRGEVSSVLVLQGQGNLRPEEAAANDADSAVAANLVLDVRKHLKILQGREAVDSIPDLIVHGPRVQDVEGPRLPGRRKQAAIKRDGIRASLVEQKLLVLHVKADQTLVQQHRDGRRGDRIRLRLETSRHVPPPLVPGGEQLHGHLRALLRREEVIMRQRGFLSMGITSTMSFSSAPKLDVRRAKCFQFT
eukprot:scaffold4097_cov306-Pinguiococcus_pyrenoidosus.AAC.13